MNSADRLIFRPKSRLSSSCLGPWPLRAQPMTFFASLVRAWCERRASSRTSRIDGIRLRSCTSTGGPITYI
jgi:hypothetical protein